jgi:hypothetical protein
VILTYEPPRLNNKDRTPDADVGSCPALLVSSISATS